VVEQLRERGILAKVLVAFACVYFIWGSTFLAIRIAVVSLPPMLMCAVRLLVAGLALLAWARATGAAWPRGAELRNAAIVGVLLPAIGNGSVTLGVTHVPSGLVALLLGTIPLWMALLASFGRDAVRLSVQAVAGLVLGFCGIALLIGPALAGAARTEFPAAWALLPIAGSLSWAWGSLWSRRVRMPSSPLASTGVGMLAGGAFLLAASGALGEFARFDAARVTWPSVAALAYLAAFGSVVGFSAYLYLLRHVPPALVATYAFVNPVVAMALGWLFAHEALSARSLTAAALVVVAVALITTARAGTRARAASAATTSGPRAQEEPCVPSS
jgi:drug/metabolite transporter (DMT)-like permease